MTTHFSNTYINFKLYLQSLMLCFLINFVQSRKQVAYLKTCVLQVAIFVLERVGGCLRPYRTYIHQYYYSLLSRVTNIRLTFL